MSNSVGPEDLPIPSLSQRIEVGLQIDIEGHINPNTFLPQWFGHEGLLADGEVRDASNSLDQDDGSVFFRTQDLALEATFDRLRLYSVHEGLQLAYRDLVLNIFALLRHTPLSWLRIIRFAHLAPALPVNQPVNPMPEPPLAWERLANLDPLASLVSESSVASVSVEGTGPGDSRTTLTVEPSHLENAKIFVAGAYVYDLTPRSKNRDITSSDILVVTLKDEWERVVAHSEQIFNYVGNTLFAPRES